MRELLQDFASGIKEECCNGLCEYSHTVSEEDCKEAILHLHSGKHDGHAGHYSDHLIHATPKLHSCIALMFSAMLSHGFSPDGYLLSTLIPIPKSKRKSLNDSSNYRGIALSSILGKTFDWIILTRYHQVLQSSDYQFGFKRGHSTVQCSFVVQETIQYYINHGSTVNAILLDATKAFDRVQYVKLFRLLLKKGMCPLLARFLCILYTNQKVTVKWANCNTSPFEVSNGVKQGGVLSPILFGIYIDELLSRLRVSGYGCYIGDVFHGAMAYADDIIMLAPAVTAVNKMLAIVNQFATEYSVKFNPSKSQHLVFGQHGPSDTCVELDGKYIKLCKEGVHLGLVIGEEAECKGIEQTKQDFNNRVNCLNAQFGSVQCDVKYKLFKAFCMALYGCPLWDLSGKHISSFYTAWRKAIRKIMALPNTTHNILLAPICNDVPVEGQLHSRFLKFLFKALNSCNECVKLCSQLALKGSRSKVCCSINYVCATYNLDKHALADCNIIATYKKIGDYGYDRMQEEDRIKAGCIRDLIVMREQNKFFEVWEINDLLTFLGTS